MAEPFARLQSVAARRLELVEVIGEAQRLGSPPRLRRSFPLFVVHDGRVFAARARRCAKWAYNFNPRKRQTRAAWAKAKRDQRRAAGQCLGCGRSNRGAYCLTCRPRRGGARG